MLLIKQTLFTGENNKTKPVNRGNKTTTKANSVYWSKQQEETSKQTNKTTAFEIRQIKQAQHISLKRNEQNKQNEKRQINKN